MILQTLDAYYRRKQMDPDPSKRLPSFGLEDKEIPFVLDIDEDGRLINITDTRSGEGKKKVGQRFLVPQGVKKTSGVAANLLWDTAEYVLGIDTRDKPERVAEQHAAFRARIEALQDAARKDAGISAVLAFLDAFTPEMFADLPEFADIQATNPVMSFRLHGDLELVCQRPAVVATTANQTEEVPDGMCLVSGAPAAIERLHPAIKGVWGAQTSGANIVSFNLDAFSSYGKAQGANAPLGKAAVFAYTTALNHLLARDSRQRIQVGDSSTVFWAEEPHELEGALLDLFGEPPKDNPDKNTDAIKALYVSIASGQFSVGGLNTSFHVLGLAPNAARISIRFWETTTAAELAQRIKQHFDDLSITHAPHEPDYLSLFRLLTGVALLNKADNIPPNLGGEVMRAILEGLPYPAMLLNQAVMRCRAEQRPTYTRAAVIKACLNRHIRFRKTAEKEFTPMLDPSNNNPAYRLGRLFATLERIQEDASGGPGKLNATIRDRYYGAASSTPAAVFPTLLRLSKAHLGKLSAGFAITRERLIGEIMDGFDADTFPPRHLALPDQARFALGYYQQRQAFFAKTEPKTPEKTQ
ncbi:type I-C CRISPR-associated protein Cas8c/Csd1 [Acidithiobacillus ferrooxidans]|uniref:type I-C CRISPR-associated protein Cas8c/Csd1 n=1 Tax=Acidithiobacillus ferrooxidans TaxID=920 RepID=UPI000A570548|nr:type I-C CRISPR-associated protein Cas8c/Csd1 [Acidithiobacillus ferrooxidans]